MIRACTSLRRNAELFYLLEPGTLRRMAP